MRTIRLLFLGLAVTLAGCHTGTLPDPNDPKDIGAVSPDILRDQLASIADMLDGRVHKLQISDRRRNELIQQSANSLLEGFKPDKIEASKAWEVADVMRTAKRWSEAKPMLEGAVEWAKTNRNEDRRVNDSLRLAQVEAELNDVPAAIRTARSVFGVKPGDAAPILSAVEYEIVPAARGKGHDLELAALLEDAISIDFHVEVNLNTDAGKLFVSSRPHHRGVAWRLLQELYEDANRPDLRDKAREKLDNESRAADRQPVTRL